MTGIALLCTSTILSAVSLGIIRRIVLAQRMIDIPNERSSHKVPTPRGGGLGIVMTVFIGVALLRFMNVIDNSLALALFIGGIVALIGYIDDRKGLSPLVRAFVHLASASLGLLFVGGMPPLDFGFTIIEWGWIGNIVAVVGIVWMINLYNFMDGIDGLAGSEAVIVFGIAGLLLSVAGLAGLSLVCTMFAGASLGFLFWNWPPAKIFMGDVGSGFLGYSIAIVAIASGKQGFSLWIWLILLVVFVVDATVTLLRRALHGEKWYQPHRSHAYQHLTQNWGSHLRVTLCILVINLFWLTPFAIIAYLYEALAIFILIIALVPLIWVTFRLGAGQDLPRTKSHVPKRV